MATFADVSKQIHLIDDLILAEMLIGKKDYCEESIQFSKHLLLTKYWFMRISWKNKRQFTLTLLKDVKSVWTLSLLLKSIWNCRSKDAISSICEKQAWSSYDQVPMDNNRTALPESMVQQAMSNDHQWFLTLQPEQQALVISELLTVSGGSLMLEVLRNSQQIYETNRERELEEISDYAVIADTEKTKPIVVEQVQSKKDTTKSGRSSLTQSVDTTKLGPLPGQAQRELDIVLSNWNSTIKSIRDSYKLEELEITLKDETKKTIWKVNRPRPESLETVDFIQLLPSFIGKRILMYVPQTQFGDLSRVNKYWALLIDEIKAESQARQRINMDLEKLRDIILRNDQNMAATSGVNELDTVTSYTKPTSAVTKSIPSHTLRKIPRKPTTTMFKPFKKMSDLMERLEKRGATDENIWKWCSNLLKIAGNNVKQQDEGTLPLGSLNFPCPLMIHKFKIPLEYPLTVDPALNTITSKNKNPKRSNKWNMHVSTLCPVTKVPSYMSI